MRRHTEYAVRSKRFGSHDQVRIFQTRFYAQRHMERVYNLRGSAPLEYLRIERRSVGPWEMVYKAVER